MFSSYNIKRILPRLIAAAILIQLSWALGTFAVSISNDLGKGVNELMYAPFEGSIGGKADDIGQALGNTSVAAGGTILFAGGVALVLFSGISIIGLIILAIPVLLAVIVGWFVLVLRQILIIMCVVFLPLALLAWILPGTDRYWKLFKDNFLKLLIMYPMIVALIAAGRIFGTIGGAVGGLAGFVIVLMGFFGPLFILPKTFAWGGVALGAMGGAVVSGTKKYRDKPRDFAMGRAKMNKDERTRRSQERTAAGVPFNARRPWQLPVDKLKSGQWDPTLGGRDSRIRQRKVDSYVHSGEETYQKDVEAARSRVLREGQDVRARGGNWDTYFQAVADGEESYYDEKAVNDDGTKGRKFDIGRRSEVEQDAARKQTAILGSAVNWRYLEEYYEANLGKDSLEEGSKVSPAQRVRARKFFDDNVGTIMPKMPHLYQGYGAAADATGGTLAGMHGVEIESILGRLSEDSKKGDTNAQKSLVTFLQNFEAAASNENIDLDNGALRAVKGFLDTSGGKNFRNEINLSPTSPKDGRSSRGLPTVQAYDTLNLEPENKAVLDSIKASLSPRINPITGTLTTIPEPGAPPSSPGFVPARTGAVTYPARDSDGFPVATAQAPPGTPVVQASHTPAATVGAGLTADRLADAVTAGEVRAAKKIGTDHAVVVPQVTNVQVEGGTLSIPHQRGESISDGGVILPTERRIRPEGAAEDDHPAP